MPVSSSRPHGGQGLDDAGADAVDERPGRLPEVGARRTPVIAPAGRAQPGVQPGAFGGDGSVADRVADARPGHAAGPRRPPPVLPTAAVPPPGASGPTRSARAPAAPPAGTRAVRPPRPAPGRPPRWPPPPPANPPVPSRRSSWISMPVCGGRTPRPPFPSRVRSVRRVQSATIRTEPGTYSRWRMTRYQPLGREMAACSSWTTRAPSGTCSSIAPNAPASRTRRPGPTTACAWPVTSPRARTKPAAPVARFRRGVERVAGHGALRQRRDEDVSLPVHGSPSRRALAVPREKP